MGFKDIQKRIKEIDKQKLLEQSAEKNGDVAVKMNKEQLLKGKDSNNEDLENYSDLLYAAYKQGLNPIPPFGTPDLKLTGAFHKGFYFNSINDRFIIDSKDVKRNRLAGKYSTDIFGLNKQNTNTFNVLVTKTYTYEWFKLAGL